MQPPSHGSIILKNGYILVIFRSNFYLFSCLRQVKTENSADTTAQAESEIHLIAVKAEKKKGAGNHGRPDRPGTAADPSHLWV